MVVQKLSPINSANQYCCSSFLRFFFLFEYRVESALSTLNKRVSR